LAREVIAYYFTGLLHRAASPGYFTGLLHWAVFCFARAGILCGLIAMSITLADAKKHLCGLVGKAQSSVATVTVKRRSPAAKSDPVRRRSEILTEQWRARRKTVLLNPNGLPRLSLAKLIQAGRK
jgi:hypothetical protein